jgi:hypothetical protein
MSVCSLRRLIRPLVDSTDDREQRGKLEGGGAAVSFDGAGSIRETLFVGHERLCIVVYCSVINASFCFLQCMICSHHASSSSPLFICAESIIGCIFSPLDLFNTFLPFLIFAYRDLYDICFVYDEMEIYRYWLNG